jgi:hypothetical protein
MSEGEGIAATMSTQRPNLESCQSGAELRVWYWMKTELVAEARRRGLPTTGGKFEILDRLCAALDGTPQRPQKHVPRSRFDWHVGPVDRDTIITDSYRNNQTVRQFFCAELGADFKFTIALMDWIRAHPGRRMADAVQAARDLRAATLQPGYQTEIKPHNQWNAYLRAFLADNPHLGSTDARRVWAKKRALPSADGRHQYSRSDLDL